MDIRVKVIGLAQTKFDTAAGTSVAGYKLYYTYPNKNVDGVACASVFCSEAKMSALDRLPEIGDDVMLSLYKYKTNTNYSLGSISY